MKHFILCGFHLGLFFFGTSGTPFEDREHILMTFPHVEAYWQVFLSCFVKVLLAIYELNMAEYNHSNFFIKAMTLIVK